MSATVNDLLQQEKTAWISLARKKADQLLRYKDEITIEDVLEHIECPKYLHRNTIGSVLTGANYKAMGYTNSKRRQSHGRVIRVWTRKAGENPVKEYGDAY